MKKYFLILTAIATTSVVFSQRSKVQSAYSYNKAFTRTQKCNELKDGLEAINAAKDHEQTKGEAKTWYYRGNLYYNVIASGKEECKAMAPNALEECTDSYLKALVFNFDDPELKKLDLENQFSGQFYCRHYSYQLQHCCLRLLLWNKDFGCLCFGRLQELSF